MEGTVLCVAHVHPDLGSDQNTLNQLGPNEGHFALSFILYIRENAWSPRTVNRAKDQNNTIRNNNTGVFTAHVNKNTWLIFGTPTGKVKD